MPDFKQVFIAGNLNESDLVLERMVYCLRKRIENNYNIYIPSLSSRTVVYKGMLTTGQLEEFFPDLSEPLVESSFALTLTSVVSASVDVLAFSNSYLIFSAAATIGIPVE